ncbi:membrane protein [Arthrobacter phage DrYang]|uniref:Membrane protein n=1 Tax=Arthrobacter phage DrYang TaxID=2686080 RepID=A0A6B9JEA3_9CAUD|nr:membrane protein [Arthrobacter phage DrYang]QGZ17172.1 membrane protein [Arthrobacter phage DrYang]
MKDQEQEERMGMDRLLTLVAMLLALAGMLALFVAAIWVGDWRYAQLGGLAALVAFGFMVLMGHLTVKAEKQARKAGQ